MLLVWIGMSVWCFFGKIQDTRYRIAYLASCILYLVKKHLTKNTRNNPVVHSIPRNSIPDRDFTSWGKNVRFAQLASCNKAIEQKFEIHTW